MEIINYELYHGDCLVESDKIENGSVDLILTDLPYGTVKNASFYDYCGGVQWDVIIPTDKVMAVANRILRINGRMVLFSQEPYTTELINGAIANVPFNYRMIWEKDHFANALLSKKAPVSYYEDILVFTKQHDFEGLHPLRRYFKEVMDYMGCTKKNVIDVIGQKADHVFRVNSSQFDLCTEKTYCELIDLFGIDKMEGFMPFAELAEINATFNATFNLWNGKEYKGNILKYKKDYNGYHPTQKPVLLLEDLIKTFSNRNNLVVDLTMGSGTTGVACMNTNRRFIGIEKEKQYFDIAQKRISEASKVTNLFNTEETITEQLCLS